MKSKLFLLSVLLLFASGNLLAIEWDDSKFMRLDDVKPGMKGKGKTVFSGTTVEEFDFEVLSVEKNFMPQWDVIWARGSGKNFEYTGVAGGMSGSPCYINGRLIGALSFDYYFQKYGDMFGITPIEEMIQVTKRPMKPNMTASGGMTSPPIPYGSKAIFPNAQDPYNLQIPEEISSQFPQLPLSQKLEDPLTKMLNSSRASTPMTPKIPIAISGLNPRSIDLFQPFFDNYGLYAVQGGGGGSVNAEVPLEPGQIVGIEFARGDYTAFSYGTITYVEGDQLLAFGHPMFGEGNVNLPLSAGYVHYIAPSISRSFKVASPTKPIGTLVQDRQTAIAGLIGPAPSFIPVHIQVKTADGIDKKLSFEVMRHRDFSAFMVMIGAASIISGVDKDSGDYTVETSTTISMKDHPAINKNDTYSGTSPWAAAFQALSPISYLTSNPFQSIEIEKIDLKVALQDKRKMATIESVRIDKNLIKPGEEIELQVSLKPYMENPISVDHKIQIPADLPEGNYLLMVSSASAARAFEFSRAPTLFQPKDLDQLLEIIKMGDRSDEIVVELFSPKVGLAIPGAELPNLPLSVLSVMNSPKQSGERGLTRGVKLLKDKISTEYVISGQQALQIQVDEDAK